MAQCDMSDEVGHQFAPEWDRDEVDLAAVNVVGSWKVFYSLGRAV